MKHDIRRKLRALLAKAEGTTGPEADAFARKVRELLAKHQLDMSDLREEDDDPLGAHPHGFLVREDWELAVASIGAEYLGAATAFRRLGTVSLGASFFGRESACVTSVAMVGFWIDSVRKVAAETGLREENVGIALAARLDALLRREGPAPSNGRDLVPISNALALVSALGGEVTDLSGSFNRDGREAAEGIPLALQATADEKRRLR